MIRILTLAVLAGGLTLGAATRTAEADHLSFGRGYGRYSTNLYGSGLRYRSPGLSITIGSGYSGYGYGGYGYSRGYGYSGAYGLTSPIYAPVYTTPIYTTPIYTTPIYGYSTGYSRFNSGYGDYCPHHHHHHDHGHFGY